MYFDEEIPTFYDVPSASELTIVFPTTKKKPIVKNVTNKPMDDFVEETQPQVEVQDIKQDDKQEKIESIDGISICITAWNAQDYIEECLDSVARQSWFKDHDNWEILVGIDGCEKTLLKVKEIMHKYKNLRVLMMDSNKGIGVTANTIMMETKYEYLLKFGCDCIMKENLVELVMNYTDYDVVRWNFESLSDRYKINIGVSYGEHLLRKSIFCKYGGYEHTKNGLDSNFIVRLQNVIKSVVIDDILSYRKSQSNSCAQLEGVRFNSKFYNMCNSVASHIKKNSTNNYAIEMVRNTFYELPYDDNVSLLSNNFIVDVIENDKPLKCKNKLHILIVDYKQLEYTQHIISDLIIQTQPFDLTIFEQVPDDKAKMYMDDLVNRWNLKGCEVNVILNPYNAPLNHIWNWFYRNTTNEYLAFLNNDMQVCNNFVSDAIEIFEKEEKCGVVVHPTNNRDFRKKNELEYAIQKQCTMQGWDFIIRRDIFTIIPDDLYVWSGDRILFQGVLEKGYFEVYDISSPIIHYFSRTIDTNKDLVMQQCMDDKDLFHNKYENKNIELLSSITNEYTRRVFNSAFSIDNTKKIIVSFTSWEKRIGNVRHIVDLFMKQTMRPYKIILNLSIEEFKNKKHLLDDVKQLEKDNPIFEINMVDGENTTIWKKFIPIIDKYPNDIICTIDDDMEYPKDYIQMCWESYLKNPYNPLSGIDKVWYGLHHCSGAFNILQYKFMKLYLDLWKDVCGIISSSDTFYVYIHKLNGYDFKTSNKVCYKKLNTYNDNDGYSKRCMKINKNWTLYAYDYLISKYGYIDVEFPNNYIHEQFIN